MRRQEGEPSGWQGSPLTWRMVTKKLSSENPRTLPGLTDCHFLDTNNSTF